MPVYQMKCKQCGQEFEVVCPVRDRLYQSCECGAPARVIPAASGVNTINEDAGWIKTVLEVVDKEDRAPHTVEFLRNPTRSNYRAWMKGERLRPVDHGEKLAKQEPIDVRRHADHLMQRHQERKRIYAGGR